MKKVVDKSTTQYEHLEENLHKQKELNLKKLDLEFALIQKMIDNRKSALKEKITQIYDSIILENSKIVKGYKAILNWISYLSGAEGEKNIDVIKFVHRFDDILNKLQEIDLVYRDDHNL